MTSHKIHKETGIDSFDVFIAGSGPIGATHAWLLVNKGYNVCMVEIGDVHDSRHPGAHLKNEIRFQKDIDKFVRVIQGALSTVSVPASSMVNPTLDPSAWRNPHGNQATIAQGRNTFQEQHNNLGAEAVTRCVGGMSTHWTCATPEFAKGIERPEIFPADEKADDDEWAKLYSAARVLIGTSDKEFDYSIRHNVVLNALKSVDEYKQRHVRPLPLACHRIGKSPYVRWHAAENIFGKGFFKKHAPRSDSDDDSQSFEESQRGRFCLLSNTRCTKLASTTTGGMVGIQYAEVYDLIASMKGEPATSYIKAKVFIIASGAVATPQILANSGFGGRRVESVIPFVPNLGRYITEQPMAFCQIVLRQGLVEDVTSETHPDWWKQAVKAHVAAYPNDLPIPFQDPEPQVTIPLSKEFPWHTQIHRDAFSYGEAGPLIDSRLVVDLRFFGRQAGVRSNRIVFEEGLTDAYGMPQPTFEYTPTKEYALEATAMMNDMTNVANALGGYLPDSYPQFMTPGLALHLGGSVRLGQKGEESESVADYNSLVWKSTNLYVAGNGVIPTAFAANPTLTSMAFAIRSAKDVDDYLQTYKLQSEHGRWKWSANNAVPSPDILPTPDDWLAWTKPGHPNYPDHSKLRDLDNRVVV